MFSPFLSVVTSRSIRNLSGLTLSLLIGTIGLQACSSNNGGNNRNDISASGIVQSNGRALGDFQVSLYASYSNADNGQPIIELQGTATTDQDGEFKIDYALPSNQSIEEQPVMYFLAERGSALLASAVDLGSVTSIVINERTTVATGTAFAQFIAGREMAGNTYGMYNAVRMAANMANPENGAVGTVLDNTPNGSENRTRATFNSLANMVSGCVVDQANCLALFELSTPPGIAATDSVLQAIANITKYPSNAAQDLFALSLQQRVYQPSLDVAPSSWLLFIKFTGGQYSDYASSNMISGPGNIAFDERGHAWVLDNYEPTAELRIACSGLRLLRFYPWGETYPGSPYFGGGLSGAGFGISFDPKGDLWVGNYGFEAVACSDGIIPPDPDKKTPAPHNSVSRFNSDGEAISGSDGYTQGQIWWPQGTVSDKEGNIFVANCGNDTVTFIPQGDPEQARNLVLPGGLGAQGIYQAPVDAPGSPVFKPFAIAIDPQGRAWVTANKLSQGAANDPNPTHGGLYRILSDGTVEALPHTGANSQALLSWPLGISGDSVGNMWVSNSDSVNVPCVDPFDPQVGTDPSVALYPADDSQPVQFTGGGLTIPWGNAVDGNDTLWVFNFGRPPMDLVDEPAEWDDTPVSHFCGVDTSKCPPGLSTGDPISPATGYLSDALDRITGGGIDASGNVWLLNNWKKLGATGPVYATNPGGNSIVIVPGAAGPVTAPLIGPPVAFD